MKCQILKSKKCKEKPNVRVKLLSNFSFVMFGVRTHVEVHKCPNCGAYNHIVLKRRIPKPSVEPLKLYFTLPEIKQKEDQQALLKKEVNHGTTN